MPAENDVAGPFPGTAPPPERIPIGREPGYHTDTIGRHAAGLFYAAGCSLPSNEPGADRRDDAIRRCYDYLHLFDADGRHIRSDIRFVGFGRGHGDEMRTALLGTLSDVEFCDIAVRPFRVAHDGYVFGLIDESSPDRGPWFELYPNGLGFGPPFAGDYDT